MVIIASKTCADRERGAVGSGPHPLENHLAIGFINNTVPEPLENHKVLNVGPSSAHQRNAITPLAVECWLGSFVISRGDQYC